MVLNYFLGYFYNNKQTLDFFKKVKNVFVTYCSTARLSPRGANLRLTTFDYGTLLLLELWQISSYFLFFQSYRGKKRNGMRYNYKRLVKIINLNIKMGVFLP